MLKMRETNQFIKIQQVWTIRLDLPWWSHNILCRESYKAALGFSCSIWSNYDRIWRHAAMPRSCSAFVGTHQRTRQQLFWAFGYVLCTQLLYFSAIALILHSAWKYINAKQVLHAKVIIPSLLLYLKLVQSL